MFSIIPARRNFLALLKGKKSCKEVSDYHQVLCAGHESISPPAIYLENQLDRVTQTEMTLEHEMRRLNGGNGQHSGTVAYFLSNVAILDGFAYKGPMKHALTHLKAPIFSSAPERTLPKAAMGCSAVGNRYFGHWLRDDLPRILAARDIAPVIAVKRHLTGHQLEYSQILEANADPVGNVFCKELIILEDIGQNHFKRKRYESMRSQLKRLNPGQSVDGVMILRGASGQPRILVNEAEVANYLKARGFAIVDPSTMSVREMARHALGAKIVVGVEGSHLGHGLFMMADGGTMLTLQPPYRFNNVYKDPMDCLGMRYAFVVGRSVARGFEIDIDELEETLVRVHRAQAAN